MNTTTCTADDEGRPCPRDAVMLRPVALCHPHRIEVALTVVPELLRDQLGAALRGVATAPAVRSELVATAVAVNVAELLHGVHDSVVYLIANGGRVKIGYTTNLKARLSALALRRDCVLLALRGGPELEQALHARFAKYRDGNSEWFELSPEVVRYVAAPHPSATAAATPQRSTPSVVATARKATTRRPRKKARRSMTEWVELAGPIFHAEFERLRRNPTAHEFATAIKRAGYGAISDSTAKNIRTEILDRAELPALD